MFDFVKFGVWQVLFGGFCFGVGFLVSAALEEHERRKREAEEERWKAKLYPHKPIPR